MEEEIRLPQRRGAGQTLLLFVAPFALLLTTAAVLTYRFAAPSVSIRPALPADASAEPTASPDNQPAVTTTEVIEEALENTTAADPTPDEPAKKSPLQQLVGTWFQERFGRRTLTIRSDGTALMIIEPSDVFAFAFGKRVEVQLTWEFDGDRAKYRVVDGSPKDKLELAKKSWGDAWDEQVVDITEMSFVLVGADGVRYEWRRATDDTQSATRSNDS